MIGVVVFGLLPVTYCVVHYMSDVREYLRLDEDTELEDAENILVWQVSSPSTLRLGAEIWHFIYFLESPLWTSLVRLCIRCISNSLLLAILCLELMQCLESSGWQEDTIKFSHQQIFTFTPSNSQDNTFSFFIVSSSCVGGGSDTSTDQDHSLTHCTWWLFLLTVQTDRYQCFPFVLLPTWSFVRLSQNYFSLRQCMKWRHHQSTKLNLTCYVHTWNEFNRSDQQFCFHPKMVK